MGDGESSKLSATPRRAFKAISTDSTVAMRLGVVAAVIGGVFAAGAWAAGIAGSIQRLTDATVRSEARMEKIENLMLDMMRSQGHHP